jgi:hypothetical protein
MTYRYAVIVGTLGEEGYNSNQQGSFLIIGFYLESPVSVDKEIICMIHDVHKPNEVV